LYIGFDNLTAGTGTGTGDGIAHLDDGGQQRLLSISSWWAAMAFTNLGLLLATLGHLAA
jgi:hypothetical protein